MKSYIAYEHKDEWKNFDYNFRYLDAISSIFHTYSPVTAAIEVDEKIYLSYSNDPFIVPDQLLLFDFIKSNISKGQDYILIPYLLYNLDFRNTLNNAKRLTSNDSFKDIINQFDKDVKEANKSFIKSVKKKEPLDLDKYSHIDLTYKELIFHHKLELGNDYDKFIRPIQDSYKTFQYLASTNYIKDIILLRNPHAIHADTNIVGNFPDSEYIDKKYIGVSKLCCGYCHAYLDKKHYDHRGTHGVCDEKWGYPWLDKETISPIEDKFKQSIKPIEEFNQLNPPQQHRRLSIDEFEQKLLISKDKSLWDFKMEIGFIKKSEPIKSEQNLSLVEEIIEETSVFNNHTDQNVLKVIGGGNEPWEGSDDLYC